MHKVKCYKDLFAWKKGLNLARDIYEITKEFPKDERFCLTSQMRRAAVSIVANIAEGNGRNTTGEYRQALGISKGSHAELETLIQLSLELGYTDEHNGGGLLEQCAEVGRLINGLMKSLPSNNR